MKSLDTIKVLAVDDHDDILEIYEDIFKEQKNQPLALNFELATATSINGTFERLKVYKPDILILDVYIENDSGLELCKQVRRWSRNGAYIGIIFVTAEQSPELLKAGLDLGADDFCSKSQIVLELSTRIRSVLRIKKLADSLQLANNKLKTANERLVKLTITDELTKLYNMRYFKRRLNEEFTRAKRYKKNLSLIMLDLDYFKSVNDDHDHLMGSFVLSEIGSLILKAIRNLDIPARYGGDEFIILLPETAEAGAYKLAERVSEKIKSAIFDNGKHQLNITASIGVGTMSPQNFIKYGEAHDLIREADEYLYEAKESGRARVCAAKRRFDDK